MPSRARTQQGDDPPWSQAQADQVNLVPGLVGGGHPDRLGGWAPQPRRDVDAVLLTVRRISAARRPPRPECAARRAGRGAARRPERTNSPCAGVTLTSSPAPDGAGDAAVLHEIFPTASNGLTKSAVRHGALFAPYLRRSLD